MDFHFEYSVEIQPSYSWWERVVPTVKRLLRTIFRRASLRCEALMAILCNDEPAINSSNLT
jgi:hypothetical protein